MKCYEYINFDEDSSARYRIDSDTGEFTKEILTYVPEGAHIITPEMLAVWREKKKLHEEKDFHRAALTPLGRDYFFVDRLTCFRELKNQTVGRLILLSTYLPGGSLLGSNQLYLTRITPMKKEHLQNVLGVGRHARDDFLKGASNYLKVEADGSLILDPHVFKRGPLPKRYQELQRGYVTGIRQLFRETPANLHRVLGLVFKLIPFLNIEYNILCHNPEELEYEAVEPLTVKEMCELTGYDYSEVYKLKKTLSSICFSVSGHKERFFSFVQSGTSASQVRMFLNPHIFYCGSNYEKVEMLGEFRDVAQT